jgi:hypothetical protein
VPTKRLTETERARGTGARSSFRPLAPGQTDFTGEPLRCGARRLHGPGEIKATVVHTFATPNMSRREAAHTSYLCDECAAERRAAWARCYPDARPFEPEEGTE